MEAERTDGVFKFKFKFKLELRSATMHVSVVRLSRSGDRDDACCHSL
jgi:hypothetical protein